MKKLTGILIKAAVCILIIASLSGCWSRHELESLGIVMGVGVDESEEPGKVLVTTQIVKPGEMKSGSKGKGGGVESSSSSEAFWNLEGTGYTISGALMDSMKKSSRRLYFPHNQILIFSRKVAEESIQKDVDFFLRDPGTRNNVWFLVSEGSAGEILDTNPELEKIPANDITRLLGDGATIVSQTRTVKLRDFAEMLLSKTTAPTAPFIKVTGAGDKRTAMISGTAVFKKNKLVGEMDNSESRGLLWALGEVKGGIIEVEGMGNDKVSLRTIRAKGRITPELRNGRLYMIITINEEGNIAEQSGSENLFPADKVAILEGKKAKVIRNEVMAAVKKAKELNADVFGFGDAVNRKYPKLWKEVESKWDEVFPNVEVELDVIAKLRLMGRIIQPDVPK